MIFTNPPPQMQMISMTCPTTGIKVNKMTTTRKQVNRMGSTEPLPLSVNELDDLHEIASP